MTLDFIKVPNYWCQKNRLARSDGTGWRSFNEARKCREASYTSKRPSEGVQLHQGGNMYVYVCGGGYNLGTIIATKNL